MTKIVDNLSKLKPVGFYKRYAVQYKQKAVGLKKQFLKKVEKGLKKCQAEENKKVAWINFKRGTLERIDRFGKKVEDRVVEKVSGYLVVVVIITVVTLLIVKGV